MSTIELPVAAPLNHPLLPPMAQLRRYRTDEAAELFEHLPAVPPGALRGDFRGRIFAVKGLQRLPRPLTAALMWACQLPLPLWIGKRFGDIEGSNLWLFRTHPATFGHYAVKAATATQPLQLDYDTPRNQNALRAILGEVRQAGPELFLARMLYRTKKRTVTVLYFTLSPW